MAHAFIVSGAEQKLCRKTGRGDLSEGGRVMYKAMEKTDYHVEECRSKGSLMKDCLEGETLSLPSPQGSQDMEQGPTAHLSQFYVVLSVASSTSSVSS